MNMQTFESYSICLPVIVRCLRSDHTWLPKNSTAAKPRDKLSVHVVCAESGSMFLSDSTLWSGQILAVCRCAVLLLLRTNCCLSVCVILGHSMAETLTVALRVAEEAIEEAIAKAEEFSDSLVRLGLVLVATSHCLGLYLIAETLLFSNFKIMSIYKTFSSYLTAQHMSLMLGESTSTKIN